MWIFASLVILLLTLPAPYVSQNFCNPYMSCYPEIGDLLIGRQGSLTSNSTCGVNAPENFCVLADLSAKNTFTTTSPTEQTCYICDSRMENAKHEHRISNVITVFPANRKKWWQSANGQQEVYIQLDLEAEFQFSHLIMTFKSFRPAAMYIERSFDFGSTWRTYRYYSSNCAKDFPDIPHKALSKFGEIICTSSYTKMQPSTNGELIFRAVPSHLFGVPKDPWSTEITEMTKLTNLRIVFKRLHSLDNLEMDDREEVRRYYYYAVYEMTVRGSCSCYGHADKCILDPDKPAQAQNKHTTMVYSKCRCLHNTAGYNCELCKDFYNDLPWRPGQKMDANECKKCNCNDHAKQCRFDAAVFKASGNKSGGVCTDCQHNTDGQYCHECKPGFYQDPNLSITHPAICKKCDCDPTGTENNGECEPRTNATLNMVAGRCICKPNTDGPRCDRCKDGFWGFNKATKDICNKCDCFAPGTIPNKSCDPVDGKCNCKRYVEGRRCDKCPTNYYGISLASSTGCQPCNCNLAGSLSPTCDSISGQCVCKPGLKGRDCMEIEGELYLPKVDKEIFEGEEQLTAQVGEIRFIPGQGTGAHTGTGFVYSDDGPIVISVRPKKPGYYEIGIRIHPKEVGSAIWRSIQVQVKLPRLPDNPYCGRRETKTEWFTYDISSSTTVLHLPKSFCFDDTNFVDIVITPNESTKPNPGAKLLVDSVVIIPSIRVPSYVGIYDEDWKYCRDQILSLMPVSIEERCKKFKIKVSIEVFKGKTLKCKCNIRGSISRQCDPVGGQCTCRKNIMNRNCNKCIANHWSYGSPDGCLPCNCDPQGSQDSQCDPLGGRCLCKPNVFGNQCNRCQYGSWGFPNCRRCECNGHSDNCDSYDGTCLNCTQFTAGRNCEKCQKHYYGNPVRGSTYVPCAPCECPGKFGSGTYHADGCEYKDGYQMCKCKDNTWGEMCDKCIINYFGNPRDPKKKCQPCDCHNNIDRSVPRSCNKDGVCVKCIHNTFGSNCELCADGFYGDATKPFGCKKCICNEMGTNQEIPCDRKTGQCRCHPYVKGRSCDQCEAGTWGMTAGKGCKLCDCDPAGSIDPNCNFFTGQCKCKERFGGQNCNTCTDLHWGSPIYGCKPCNCVKEGVKDLQCNKRTGQCICKEGVTGYSCDKCNKWTRGKFPNCVPCGECWHNWRRIIQGVLEKTKEFRRKITGKISGSDKLPPTYEKELGVIEKQLKTINKLVVVEKTPLGDVRSLNESLSLIKGLLESKDLNKETMNELEKTIEANENKNKSMKNLLQSTIRELDNVKKAVANLTTEVESIKDRNPSGAFDTVQSNKIAFDKMQDSVGSMKAEDEKLRKELENSKDIINKAKKTYRALLTEIETRSLALSIRISKLKKKTLPQLNQKVCGGKWTIPFTEDLVCHKPCGGGGCPACGGHSTCDGSKDTIRTTEEHLNKTDKLLEDKHNALGAFSIKIEQLKKTANEVNEKAKEANRQAIEAANMIRSEDNAAQSLQKKMQDFLNSKKVFSSDLERLLKKIIDIEAPVTDSEVTRLQKDIKDSVKKVKNYEKTLAETKDERDRAKRLKQNARDAMARAMKLLTNATNLAESLEDTKSKQSNSAEAVKKLKTAVKEMEDALEMIRTTTESTTEKNEKTDISIGVAEKRADKIANDILEITDRITKIREELKNNKAATTKIEEKMKTLNENIASGNQKWSEKFSLNKALLDRTKKLREKIEFMKTKLKNNLQKLENAEANRANAESKLKVVESSADDLIVKITETQKNIRRLAGYHEYCT